MLKKQTNSNRSEKIASKVQTLVAEILQRDFADDDLVRGVSLVGAEAHGGMQFVKLFFYAHDKRDERTFDNDCDLINYPYTIEGIRFIVGVKGAYIGQVSYYCYRYEGAESPENNGWYEMLVGLQPPTKDTIKKYWKD